MGEQRRLWADDLTGRIHVVRCEVTAGLGDRATRAAASLSRVWVGQEKPPCHRTGTQLGLLLWHQCSTALTTRIRATVRVGSANLSGRMMNTVARLTEPKAAPSPGLPITT